ncbi:hypothetical protein HPB47_000341 [Ixodes persulcatus]|uniref:Uncharacterized protein n=1 Tax=Ixodes persulcatus TaxID=34615 RepID=A0AC60PTZ2_IXOPE|nr:hypothetical protein HPB47_000341 [Ixodes persulcatus]
MKDKARCCLHAFNMQHRPRNETTGTTVRLARHATQRNNKLAQAVMSCVCPGVLLPSRENFRDAWLKNISRQGSEKGSQWQPSSRSVVCSLHFKEEDYKVGMKRKLLQPTATFVGSSTGETGVTSLIKERLQVERKGLRSEKEPYCSLIIDEMSIQQKAVEEAEFRIVRIVTDNHQTNTAMFRQMSDDNTLQHVVPHQVCEGEPLFLSFDPNHLIKNLRTNLLEREMFDGAQMIKGGFFLKALYNIQKNLLVKPVRLLSRAHVEPNNLEKMKVCHVTLIFSPVVISTLEYLQKNPQSHERAPEFQDCSSTITFMKTVGMWYDLHDISGWKSRQIPFVRTEDDRLSWLEVDFISYLEDIKLESTKSWVKSLTKETYEATIMTTRSTVAVIEYLLTDLKFKYVLTRPLNSDPVESLFSCFRQFNGGNDRVDARTAVFTAEKLLKLESNPKVIDVNNDDGDKEKEVARAQDPQAPTTATPLVRAGRRPRSGRHLEAAEQRAHGTVHRPKQGPAGPPGIRPHSRQAIGKQNAPPPPAAWNDSLLGPVESREVAPAFFDSSAQGRQPGVLDRRSTKRLPLPRSADHERRRRGADEEAGSANIFETPVGQALLDSLSHGYTRERGLGNGLAEKVDVGRGSPLSIIWPRAADRVERRETPYDRGELFSLLVRRALMDSLCYPGYGQGLRANPEGKDKQEKHNSALRRLKRYLEIVRVEMHPGGQAQPAAEAPVLGAERHKWFWVEDRQAVSRFLESVARENLEFHTGVAHSKLHVGDHAEPGTLALSGSAEASQKGEPRRLKPSLLISLNALLTSLDGNLSNLLTVESPTGPHIMMLRSIVCVDETWVNAGHTKEFVCQDKTVKSSQDAIMKGLTTGLAAPSGEGGRRIPVHAGSNETGVVADSADLFRAKQGNAADYHSMMDGTYFEGWFSGLLLPNIPPLAS